MRGYPVLDKIEAIAYTLSNVKLNETQTYGKETDLVLLSNLADDLKRKNSTTARVDILVFNKDYVRKVKTFNYPKIKV